MNRKLRSLISDIKIALILKYCQQKLLFYVLLTMRNDRIINNTINLTNSLARNRPIRSNEIEMRGLEID